MKTILKIIIALVLALPVNTLFAGNDSNSTPVKSESAVLSQPVPASPVESTITSGSPERSSRIDLSPSTPAIADFEETVDSSKIKPVNPAPETPSEADFQ
jgi:hypothetical protein